MSVLLLGGTAEARALSGAIVEAGYPLTISLAGTTAKPASYGGRLRVGGFGGASGLAAWMANERITALVDATHPFAEQMSRNAAEAAADAGIPLLQLVRPPWPAAPFWHVVPTMAAAAQAIPSGARVLLATGHRSASAFAARADITALVRVIDAQNAPCPVPGGRWLVSPPPHSFAAETALLKEHRIDTLVARNSGGAAGLEKLEAAGAMGLRAIVVAPPALPEAQRAGSTKEAMAWLKARTSGG